MKNRAIYPGTFDPVTNGHVDIIFRASKIFSEVIVGVATSATKKPFLPLETRIDLLNQSLKPLTNVTVLGFSGLLIDFAKTHAVDLILRGFRGGSDIEYELTLAQMNRRLLGSLETLLLPPAENCRFISSTLVREIALLNGDLSAFVPPCVVKALEKKL